MKIYVGHSRDINYTEDLYKPLRESSLNTQHEIILPHETDQVFLTKDVIKDCDLMIAEVSLPATGLGIELGWANSFGKRIICIYKNGAKVSGSLKFISQGFIEYNDGNDLIQKLTEVINN